MNGFDFSWRVKLFLGVIFILPFIVLFWFVFAKDIINQKSSSETFLTMKKEISCHGNVEVIYRQKNNRNVLTLKIKKCIYQVPYKWETKFLVGDSISKKEGELFVEHYRDGVLKEILDYREIAKEMKDDDWDIMWRRLKEKLNIAKDK